MTKLRFTKEALVHKNATAVSAEIRTDRSRSNLLLVGVDTAGAIDGEFSAQTWDSLLEAALCGTWSTAGDVTLADGASTITSTNYTSATAAFVAGDVGKTISGTNIPVNTYIATVTNGTTIQLSQNATATGTTLSFTIKGRSAANVLNNGTTNRSFLIEKGYLDIAQYFSYRGMVVDEFNLDLTARALAKVNVTFMGSQAFRSGTTLAATPNPQPTTPIITSGPLITGLQANTNMTGIKIKDIKFKIKNNLRIHDVVDQLATDDLGRGVMDITGTFNAYFKNGSLYDQFLANSAISFSFVITDAVGKSYTFLMPNLKLPNADVQTPGVDVDVMLPVEFRALYDSVTGVQMRVSRT